MVIYLLLYSFYSFTPSFLECYVNTSHECAALRVSCIVNARGHRVLLAAGVYFGVVAVIAGEAEEVVAGEVDAHVLKPYGPYPLLRQGVAYGYILQAQEIGVLYRVVTEIQLCYSRRIIGSCSGIDFVQTCHYRVCSSVCGYSA